ncbi:lactate utilization protein [Natronocalculus amylovorans]|uniref:Lactate utilization protein n=1 Tax=Natronocalculus amylovorans TaxID=2917812 RepID=A0AAE3FZ03_9EURY|nr:lactate utilization protein [Natronocalculus amylovorans]MCL9817973.1 lactate utilization protein [Natronocalculus amylovorans]NUE03093.1 lactate utilization protein [Halorubraceae archaeon YAN]
MSQQTKTDYIDDVSIDNSLDSLPSDDEITATVDALTEHGFVVEVVDSTDEALALLTDAIPAGASVMNGHSTTLEEIGFMEYAAEGDHEWETLSDEIWSIDDDEAREDARRESQTADYFLGSVNAISQTGELVAADASGSRIGAYPFAAKNLFLVSGVNKIVSDLQAALDRVENVAYPLENERAQEAYGVESIIAKQLIYRFEGTEGRTTVVLINESLGY